MLTHDDDSEDELIPEVNAHVKHVHFNDVVEARDPPTCYFEEDDDATMTSIKVGRRFQGEE